MIIYTSICSVKNDYPHPSFFSLKIRYNGFISKRKWHWTPMIWNYQNLPPVYHILTRIHRLDQSVIPIWFWWAFIIKILIWWNKKNWIKNIWEMNRKFSFCIIIFFLFLVTGELDPNLQSMYDCVEKKYFIQICWSQGNS